MTSTRKQPRTLAIILGGGQGKRLYPLTKMRAKPAVPLGGKYRLIDVPISNCLNNQLNQMYVLTQFESTSLHEHVQRTYRFDRFGGGFVRILAAQQRYDANEWYQGSADAVRQNLDHYGDEWDEILILCGDQLYHMDFQDLLRRHRDAAADISIAVLPVGADLAPAMGIVQVDKSGRVLHFREKPAATALAGLETSPKLFADFDIEPRDRPYLASMGIYVFNRQLLYDELTRNRYVDFGKDLFPAVIGRYHVQTYIFDGYWEDIGTVGAFHEANLAMTDEPPQFSFRTPQGIVHTRPRTLPPTAFQRLDALRSIIVDGCRIGSARLDQSILGIRTLIGHDVRLTRTLVMGADYYESDDERAANLQSGRASIGDRVEIENAIVDKNARIGSDVVLKNPQHIKPAEGDFYVVRDGVLCILKNAIVPSGTKIGI